MRPDSLLRLWRYINLLLTYLLTCGISSLFHSVNVILFTLLTSSCAYHLITVTTFALITYHSLNLSLQTNTHLFHKSFLPVHSQFLIPTGLPSRNFNLYWTISGHWRLFVLVSYFSYFFLAAWVRVLVTTHLLSLLSDQLNVAHAARKKYINKRNWNKQTPVTTYSSVQVKDPWRQSSRNKNVSIMPIHDYVLLHCTVDVSVVLITRPFVCL